MCFGRSCAMYLLLLLRLIYAWPDGPFGFLPSHFGEEHDV